jgi:tRNA A-37 threonylcarbamoyl transferase component Bud32
MAGRGRRARLYTLTMLGPTTPPPQLVVLNGRHAGDVIVLDDAMPVVFGRRAGVRLPDPALTDVHCQVFQVAGCWYVQDFDTQTGTWIGDDRVEGVVELGYGRAFRVGDTHVALVLPDPKAPADPEFVEAAEAALRVAAESQRTQRVVPDPLPPAEPTEPAPGGPATAPASLAATDVFDLETPGPDEDPFVGEVGPAPDLSPPRPTKVGLGISGFREMLAEARTRDEAKATGRTKRSKKLLRPLEPGDKLGDYEIQGLLGEGELGQVYKGYDRRRHKSVAVKVLAPELARDAQMVARFIRGAKVGGRLRHPHLVAVLAAGHAGGRIYVTMEHVDGPDLETLCKQEPQGRLAARSAVALMARITAAVVYAHGRNVVHRNVKPRNVLVATGRIPKLSDLAFAKKVVERKKSMEITGSDEVLIRSVYAPPETIFDAKGADERSDVYGLGATLYFSLTGKPPYDSRHPANLVQGRFTDPRDHVPSLSQPLVDVLERCLQSVPDDRYQAARDLRDALSDLPEAEER